MSKGMSWWWNGGNGVSGRRRGKVIREPVIRSDKKFYRNFRIFRVIKKIEKSLKLEKKF